MAGRAVHAVAFDIGLALGATATAYALLAWVAVLIGGRRRPAPSAACEPVSILKPLHGAEPRLDANLRSFCVQQYPAYQVLFGVRDAADPAYAVATRIRQEFPQLDIEVVADARLYGENHKVSTLANLMERARHPWIVLADSDISVGPDYLRRVCAPLAQAETGIVTCLYRGRALGGAWAHLGALYINEWFAPAVRIAQLFRSQTFGFGATLALRREVLDAIGGFRGIADELADDYRLAERTRELGLRTVLSDHVVTTDVPDESLRQLASHELRWMGTIRVLNPVGYAFMLVSFGLPVAVVGAALAGWAAPGLALLAATCLARGALHFAVALRAPRWRRHAVATLPLVVVRDVLGLVLWALAFSRRDVAWAGRALHLR